MRNKTGLSVVSPEGIPANAQDNVTYCYRSLPFIDSNRSCQDKVNSASFLWREHPVLIWNSDRCTTSPFSQAAKVMGGITKPSQTSSYIKCRINLTKWRSGLELSMLQDFGLKTVRLRTLIGGMTCLPRSLSGMINGCDAVQGWVALLTSKSQ